MDFLKNLSPHAYLGNTEAARRIAADLPLSPPLSEIYMLIGDHDEAIDRLEELRETHGSTNRARIVSPGVLRVDPLWDPLREHPRFQRLLRGS